MNTDPIIDRRSAVHLSWRSPIVWLAFLITLGFFAALFTMMLMTNTSPDMMLGALMAAFSGIVGYYFGSSSTSAGKDAAISDLTKTAAVAATTTAQATQVAADAVAAAGGPVPAAGGASAPIQAGQVAIQAETVSVDSSSTAMKGNP